MQLKIEKYQVNGNNFIIVDERITSVTVSRSRLAQHLCQGQISVGADGVLFIQPSDKANLRMRLFEPDGTESDMCGNGIRCLVLYSVRTAQLTTLNIETNSGIISGQLGPEGVTVNFGPLQNLDKFVSSDSRFELVSDHILKINSQGRLFYLVNTGEPHAVIINDDRLEQHLDFAKDKQLFPYGINLNSVKIINNNTIQNRTLERGVWNYTSSCGTGSAAAAVIARLVLGLKATELTVLNDRGSQRVFFNGHQLSSVAKPRYVFSGTVEI